MPFPIYIRKLRFREVKAEITQLVKKEHWRGTGKAFQEIITLFDFLLNILKFQQQNSSIRKKRFMPAKRSLQVVHQ